LHFKKMIVEMVEILKWRIFRKQRIRVCIKVSRKKLFSQSIQTGKSSSPLI